MLRMLMFSSSANRGHEAAEAVRKSGLECLCDDATDEETFRRALTLAPDLVIVDDEASDLPWEVACDVAKATLPDIPCVRLEGGSLDQLGNLIRTELALAGIPTRRSSDQASDTGLHEVSAIAHQLLERRSALEEFVPPQERSTLASVLRRTPPHPVALVCIGDA